MRGTRSAIAVCATLALALACASQPGPPSAPPAQSLAAPPSSVASLAPTPTPVATSNGVFPATVLGMRVVSVAETRGLLAAGAIEGREVAVGGYFSQSEPPCPPPEGYFGSLEDWCHFVAFADTIEAATMCTSIGSNGGSCELKPSAPPVPWIMQETSGGDSPLVFGGPGPVAVVFVGHAADARQFQCLDEERCAQQFVVDRVAWAGGADLPLEATQASYFPLDSQPHPALTLDQLASTVGVSAGLLTAALVSPDDVASVEPRWNVAGSDLLWFVRTLGAADSTANSDDPTRAGQEWLVDDATGAVLESGSLALDPTYAPARVWFQAARGSDHLSNELDRRVPAYEVFQVTDQLLHAGHVSGSTQGRPGLITYGSSMLALAPGGYTVQFWLPDASADASQRDPAYPFCSADYTVSASEDLTVQADFGKGATCTMSRLAAPSPAR